MEKEFRRGPDNYKYEKEPSPEGQVELLPGKKIYVGVMGYSGQKFDATKAQDMLCKAFDAIEKDHQHDNIWVVSGYTNLGIPALAYKEAIRRNWQTMGIACKLASSYAVFPCDEVKLVGENWGDESPTFLAQCQVFVRVGGGKQSHREIEQAKADGKKVYEFELKTQK